MNQARPAADVFGYMLTCSNVRYWLSCYGSPLGPALSGTAGELVQLIISKLPTTDARTYRALRIFAGKSPVQVLTLTKMEVWSVPRNRVAAVKRAASRFGVSVDEFAPDWNHVLRPVRPISGDSKTEVQPIP